MVEDSILCKIMEGKHIRSINDMEETDRAVTSELIYWPQEITNDLGIASSGYRLLFNVARGDGGP
jgi:histidine triad (HIT) family protein